MLTLELPQLDLRYAGLRIADPARRARLEQAIAREGQQVPVLVITGDTDRYVLIEGYGRVDALTRLGRDTVQATVLDMGEAEALVLRHRLDHGAPRSALELPARGGGRSIASRDGRSCSRTNSRVISSS